MSAAFRYAERGDTARILQFITELATYEKLHLSLVHHIYLELRMKLEKAKIVFIAS
ncbi:MAG: hypothetical protein IJF27_01330 [Oscillospiraceae bacterium]|nr:hypothetical protein [Oscillospiraceae bacterium]